MSLLDTRITLSIPYNHAADYPEWLAENSACVSEVYLPVFRSVVATGRTWTGPSTPEAYAEALRPLAAVMLERGIAPNIVASGMVMTDQRRLVADELARMREAFGQNLRVTLSDIAFATYLRGIHPELELGVSTLTSVTTVTAAQYWLDRAGVDFICPGRDINRRPKLLRRMRDMGVTVKVVVDDCCVPNCPAALAHYTVDREGRNPRWCTMAEERQRSPWLVAQKDIVPAALPRYEDCIDVAKLQGRGQDLEVIGRAVRAYVEAESWEHPTGMYVEPEEAAAHIEECDRICPACGWCPENFASARRRSEEERTVCAPE